MTRGHPREEFVSRPRLFTALSRSRVGVVEAAGGYGKSLLAAQYGRTLGVATAIAPLLPAADAAALVGALQRALRTARLSDLAAVLRGGRGDPAARIDTLLEALAVTEEPLLLVLDDAHNATGPEAAALALRLSAFPPPHRLTIAARMLPQPLDQLRSAPDVALLGAAELAFTEAETRMLLAQRVPDLPERFSHDLWEATTGWVAALVIAASTIARAADPQAAATKLLAGSAAPAALLEALLGQLTDGERAAVIQLAHLPLISSPIADAVTGIEATLPRLVAAGVPFTRTPAGWWELPGPVLDHLTRRGRLRGDTARRAAATYAGAAEYAAALQSLLAGGEPAAAGELLATLAPQAVEDLGCEFVAEVVAALGEDVVAHHPRVLLQLARVAEATYQADLRTRALRQVDELAARGALSQREQHELDVERARDLLWAQETRPQAEALANGVLESAASDELVARARALDVLGRAYCWLTSSGPRERAQPLLVESVRISRRIGARTWAAQALIPLAWGLQFAMCRNEEALRTLDEALSYLPARSRYRAVVESFRADVLTELARPLEAEASVEEMREIGRTFGERWALAFASWVQARIASYAGDRQRTLEAVVDVERHRDEWYEQVGGLEFLAHAADLLDRVGEHELAHQYLARARARTGEFDRPVRLFTASVTGRSGDPGQARALIADMLERGDLQLQERWWLELLAAYAWRRSRRRSAGRSCVRSLPGGWLPGLALGA